MRFLLSLQLGTLAALLAGDASDQPPAKPAQTAEVADAPEIGLASYYADKYHGRLTANGETFDTHKLTAAHRTLPFGTRVKVTAVANGYSVVVRINDRGPFVPSRIIDVSRAAAEQLQMIRAGLVNVRVEIVR